MNGTINLKKLSTKMLDAISTLNTDVSNLTTSIPSQIKTNNQQTLATVEQNPEAASRAYVTGEYLVANGKLYKVLNNIVEGAALQDNVNIEWVLLGDEVSNLRESLKSGAYSEVVNDWNRTSAGGVLDARLGPSIKSKMDLADSLNTSVSQLNTKVTQLTGKLVMAYHDNIQPVDNNNKPYNVIKANTSVWFTLPVTKTGYHAVGILGFYMYAAAGTGTTYYAQNCVYEIGPSTRGATMAVTTHTKGDWVNPRVALYILWEKN